jgi:hypothetical protein
VGRSHSLRAPVCDRCFASDFFPSQQIILVDDLPYLDRLHFGPFARWLVDRPGSSLDRFWLFYLLAHPQMTNGVNVLNCCNRG